MTAHPNAARKLPDFVCVGGAKCGTTSLYEYLRQHPQVFLPDQKELHYFSYPDLATRPEGPGMRTVLSGLIRTEDSYRAQFRQMKANQIAGDISPSYLNEETVPERIHALLGRVKIIVMLRDPVYRVVSQYMHLRRAAREPLDIAAALAAEPERLAAKWGDMWHYTASAFAAERLARYRQRFGTENVLVLLSDEMRADPAETMKRVCAFLNIEREFIFATDREFNRSGAPRSRLVARLVDASPVANFAKRLLPRRLGVVIKRNLQELNTGRKEEIPGEVISALRQLYADEIMALDQALDRPTGWAKRWT